MNTYHRVISLCFAFGLLAAGLLSGCTGIQRVSEVPAPTPDHPSAIIQQMNAALPEQVFFPVISKSFLVPQLPPGKLPVEGGHSFPRPTYSYYMMSIDPWANYSLGCELGKKDLATPGVQDNLVLLDYGSPKKVNGVQGASLLMISGFASTAQIANAAQHFGWGYYVCSGDDMLSHLRIGIGTTNYPTSTNPAVTFEHGLAWAEMVNDVNAWLVTNTTNRILQQVDAVGANDIELAWNSYTNSRTWLDGYDAANGYVLYNFGALPGCPWLSRPGSQCGSYPYVWSKEQVWYVIYGAGPVYSLPEIYRVDGINAEQWYLMSVYAYMTHGAPVGFVGALSTYTACKQAGGCGTGSGALNNTPLQSWTQLYNLLNSDPRTAQGLRWVSDMVWTSPDGSVDPFGLSATLLDPDAEILVPQKDLYAQQTLLASLENPGLSAEARSSLEEKLALAAAEAAAPQAVTPASKEHPQVMQSAAAPLQTMEDLMVEGSEGLVQPSEAVISNLWGGMAGDDYLQVLAGAFTDEPDQGVLYVIALPAGSARAERTVLFAPSYSGLLRIFERQGSELVIQAANGQVLHFDLESRTLK